ncbi:MAG: hypothetical protein KJN79_09360 [Gammaproteobacteria bacterium]|nr:hypothetical protein [Gammaproteobacteria bacterium]
MTTQAMDRLRQQQHMQVADAGSTPAGQAMLEQGATIQQQRLDNYMTAVSVQQPRDKRRVIREVEFEAELLGEKAYYSWTAKGKQGRALIEGPTIDLAMVLLREWGNCASRADLVAETSSHYLFDGIFLDLERGVTVVRQFRQVKERQMGRMDADRAEDIVFQVGQSKAIRNAVLEGVPQWLIDKAITKAKTAAAKQLTPTRVIEAFAKWSVDQKTLERRCGKAAKRWDEMDMAELRGVYQGILDGMTTVDHEFGADQSAETVAQAVSETAAKAAPKEYVDPETGEVTPAAPEPEKAAEPEPEAVSAADPAPEVEKAAEPEKMSRAATNAVAAFEAVGVAQPALEQKMKKPATEWKRADLSKLRAMLQSLKDGDVSAEALFAPPSEDEEPWE